MLSRLFSDISPHALRAAVTASGFFVLVGCQTPPPPPPPLPGFGSCTPRPGGGATVTTATMPEPGVIVVNYATSCADSPPPMRIVQSEQPEGFDLYVGLAGGLTPGQTRPLRTFEGHVRMNDDRSITYNEPGNPHQPPFEMTLRPDDARYDTLLARVGGLSPGERKVVTREPSVQ